MCRTKAIKRGDCVSLLVPPATWQAAPAPFPLQVICFAFHDSSLLLETCQQAKHESKLVTLFYLD